MKYILILLIAFSAFRTHIKFSIEPQLKRHYFDTSRYFVLKYSEDNDYSYFKDKVTGFDLSHNDLSEIDSILKDAVKKHNTGFEKSYKESTDKNKKQQYDFAEKNFRIKRLSRYYKQLIGVTNKKGENIVFVNCLCETEDIKRLKDSLVLTLDGGSCFFNLKINLTKKTAYDFSVNGVA